MKKSIFFISVIIFLLGTISLQAQDIFTVLEGNYEDSEEETVQDASEDVERGNRMFSTANNQYNQYSKLFNSKKKRKRKKAEKKTIGAKQNLSSAANYYDKGYEELYNFYLEKVQSYTYEFTEDQQQVNNLLSEAESSFTSGQRTLSKHKSYSKKELKKTVKYKGLRTSVESGANSEKEAVEYLVDAIAIYLAQTEKKKSQEEKEDNAWKDAVRLNTIPSYTSYLNNFPNGAHAQEARDKIIELEEKMVNQATVVYRIQIAASKKSLSDSKVRRKCPSYQGQIYSDIVEMDEHSYKYMIGDFSTYTEARNYERSLRNREKTYFIVAYKDKTRIRNIESVCNPSDDPIKKPIR